MRTIYKYKLQPGRTVLDMPECAQVLTVQIQGGDPCMWAMVDTDQPIIHRVFDAYATGKQMPADPGDYVGTFQMDDGALVWHLFDATRPA